MQGRANSKPCLLLFQFRKTRKRMWSVDWSEYMSHGREWLFRMATVSHLWTTLDASSAVLKRNRFTNHLETIADVTSSLICWFLRFRRHMFFVVGVAVFKDDLLMFLSSPPGRLNRCLCFSYRLAIRLFLFAQCETVPSHKGIWSSEAGYSYSLWCLPDVNPRRVDNIVLVL